MVDQEGRDALLGVLSGLTKRHRSALVHITHYNNEAESAQRTLNLSDSPDNADMVETVPVPESSVAVSGVSRAPCWSSSRSDTNTAAARRGPRPR